MPYEKPLKSEKVTIRLTEEERKFIETFNEKNSNKFSVAFQNMVNMFSGEKSKRLIGEITILEKRLSFLREEERKIHSNVINLLSYTLIKLQNVHMFVDTIHENIIEKLPEKINNTVKNDKNDLS